MRTKSKNALWDSIWQQTDKVSKNINEYLNCGLPTIVKAKMNPVIKDYETLINMIGTFDKQIKGAVKPVKIKMPFESEEFQGLWQYWKDYLLEKFNIEYCSRQEQMALQHLFDISDKKEPEAMKYLKYAMATGYKNFFKVTGKTMSTPAKGEKDGDFE
jgi:hypothetical protein